MALSEKDFRWRSSYNEQTDRYLKKHFGSGQRITDSFPYMKTDYILKDKSKDVFDPRALLKINHEYHGIESLAKQYHFSAMHDYAAELWLLAADWRRDVMNVEHRRDDQHARAVEFAIRNYRYNRAVYRWQKRHLTRRPAPETFGLTQARLDKDDEEAEGKIRAAYARYAAPAQEPF